MTHLFDISYAKNNREKPDRSVTTDKKNEVSRPSRQSTPEDPSDISSEEEIHEKQPPKKSPIQRTNEFTEQNEPENLNSRSLIDKKRAYYRKWYKERGHELKRKKYLQERQFQTKLLTEKNQEYENELKALKELYDRDVIKYKQKHKKWKDRAKHLGSEYVKVVKAFQKTKSTFQQQLGLHNDNSFFSSEF